MKKNRKWTNEEKLQIVKEHLEGTSISELMKKYNIKSSGTVSCWKKKYFSNELFLDRRGAPKNLLDSDLEYEILKKSYALLKEIRSK